MWKEILLWLCLSGHCLAGPLGPKRNMPIMQRQEEDMAKESAATTVAAATENDAVRAEAATASNAPNMLMISTLTLPSNATSIRADITDDFSCANRSYGYYADVDNDCQIFHVCLPVTYADGKENLFRWSFICPEETIFSQESFTCMRREDMTIDCEESFKYYELNRNFGLTEEEENKYTVNSSDSGSSDVNKETLHAPIQDQEPAMTATVEHEHAFEVAPMIQKPMKPMTAVTQKEKPAFPNAQKPNRRKPSSPSASSPTKKKPQNMPMRKIPAATTAQPIITTTMETPAAEVETKPPRLTKRPISFSAHLKEKIQPVKQPEPAAPLPTPTPTPIRTDLYNQKRKRPSIFNKKETTTAKLPEETLATTELTAILASEPIKTQSENNSQDPITSQASEPNAITLSPKEKVPKPQPTESIAPLEAFEEIPAVITEVEELPSDQSSHKADSEGQSYIVNFPVEITENNESALTQDAPAIFQQNSEENFTSASEPSIEEMEEEKPDNAPETLPPTSDMENHDPMIDHMLTDTDTDADSNKQSMGGFKPVDPAMAAEAEALIANFLNTLMKSEKANAESVMPISEDPQTTEEIKDLSSPGSISEMETNPEMKPTIEENQKPQMEPSKGDEFPSTMMNNHPEMEFQIPVQIIQSPIEEVGQTQSAMPSGSVGAPMEPTRPLSIDDVVELVKDKLDQPSNSTAENQKDSQTPTEQFIVPIYHRGSSDPNEGSEVEISETSKMETENSTEPKNTATDRAQRARSIKTAVKMDPRKRRFLFKSDAS